MGLTHHDPTSIERWSEFLVSPGLTPTHISALKALTTALDGVEFALIGGHAVFLHGYPRFSKDIDIGVIVPVKQVSARLLSQGFLPIHAARFSEPITGVTVDVVKLPRCAIPSVKNPVLLPFDVGHHVPVVDLETLLALKLKAGRAQDEADVIELLKAGRQPDRRQLTYLLRKLGEATDEFERLARRAEQEHRQQADHEREQESDDSG